MLQNGFRIVGGERLIRAVTHADAAGIHAAGENHNHVVAQGLNLLLDLLTGSLADSDRADDGADTDNDAEHGENGPQLVPSQRPQRDAYHFFEVHSLTSMLQP